MPNFTQNNPTWLVKEGYYYGKQGITNLTETNVAKTLAVVSWADNLHFCQKQIEDCWKHFWKWHRLEIRIGGVSCYMYSDIKFLSPHQSPVLVLTNSNNASIRKAPLQTKRLLAFMGCGSGLSFLGWINISLRSNIIWAFLPNSWQFLTFTTMRRYNVGGRLATTRVVSWRRPKRRPRTVYAHFPASMYPAKS